MVLSAMMASLRNPSSLLSAKYYDLDPAVTNREVRDRADILVIERSHLP
jgi:hypothetical protein